MIQLNDKESYLLNPSRILAVYKTNEGEVREVPSQRWWKFADIEVIRGYQIQAVMEGDCSQVLTYDTAEARNADYDIIKRSFEMEASHVA